jgi:hypothetical protein
MADQPTREEAQALYAQMSNADLQAELGDRQLAKTGTKPELVARLLDDDFPPGDAEAAAAADEAEQAAAAPSDPPAPDDEDDDEVEDGELCGNCWPDGWPSPDTNNASCEHGVWDR